MQQISVRQAPSGPSVLLNIPTTTDDLANASTVNGGTGTLTQALNTLNAGAAPGQFSIVRQGFGGGQMVAPQVITDGVEQPVTDGVNPLFAELTAPEAGKAYAGRIDFDVEYYGGTIGDDRLLAFYLQFSIDNGGSWANAASSSQNIYAEIDRSSSRHCSINLPPTAGATLGIVTGVTPSLRFRLAANTDTPGLNSELRITSPQGSSPFGSGTLAIVVQELNP